MWSAVEDVVMAQYSNEVPHAARILSCDVAVGSILMTLKYSTDLGRWRLPAARERPPTRI